MAVSTATKRQAALRYGMTHLAGTRRPKASIPAFDRAALLGCYRPVSIGTPSDGWMFERSETVWIIAPDERVFTFGD